jgi:hypothetical protein
MAMITEDPKSSQSKQATINAYNRLDRKVAGMLAMRLARWWDKVLIDAKALCLMYKCYDTGALYESIRVESRDEVGTTSYFEKVIDVNPILDRVLIAGGPEYINWRTKKGVDYAQAVHDGHNSPNGYVAGRPFMSDAVTNNLPELEKIFNEFGLELDKEWLKD